MFSQVSEGALISFLASAKQLAFANATAAADRPQGIGKDTPTHKEDISQLLLTLSNSNDAKSVLKNYLAERTSDDSLFNHGDSDLLHKAAKVLLTNKVKKCSACHKPNGFTLSICNQCGADLTKTDISFTNNVFNGFIFGFEKAGPIPLKISMRHSCDRFIVMDDLLSLAPLHFNVIPTAHYIPDWRYLLLRPRLGLELITQMFSACVEAGKTLFARDDWRSKFIRSDTEEFDFHKHIAAGFNYPPSQYQLHIQFMAPCLLPFQWAQAIKGVHFTFKRFFPFAYVKEVLEALINEGLAEGVESKLDTPTDLQKAYFSLHSTEPCLNVDKALPFCVRSADGDALPDLGRLMAFVEDHLRISYLDAHTKHVTDFAKHQSIFSNWTKADFNGMIVTSSTSSVTHTDAFLPFDASSAPVGSGDSQMVTSDKAILQSYGRPYTSNGSPSGCYYDCPKAFNDVKLW